MASEGSLYHTERVPACAEIFIPSYKILQQLFGILCMCLSILECLCCSINIQRNIFVVLYMNKGMLFLLCTGKREGKRRCSLTFWSGAVSIADEKTRNWKMRPKESL